MVIYRKLWKGKMGEVVKLSDGLENTLMEIIKDEMMPPDVLIMHAFISLTKVAMKTDHTRFFGKVLVNALKNQMISGALEPEDRQKLVVILAQSRNHTDVKQ